MSSAKMKGVCIPELHSLRFCTSHD